VALKVQATQPNCSGRWLRLGETSEAAYALSSLPRQVIAPFHQAGSGVPAQGSRNGCVAMNSARLWHYGLAVFVLSCTQLNTAAPDSTMRGAVESQGSVLLRSASTRPWELVDRPEAAGLP
jgi:hypothetical protein